MKRTHQPKTEQDYAPLVRKELKFYAPMASELDISIDVLGEAAQLGVRSGLRRHRASGCRQKESGCVSCSVRHFCDRIVVKTCLMAVNEQEMEQAEDILMKLIED